VALESTLPYTSITVMQLVTAAIVLVVGFVVARIIIALFKRSMRKTKLSDVLIEFLARFMSALLYVLVILLVLAALGVTISSILVSLSAMVGLILGFGMSDTVNNIASGTWIAALGPIDIGEVVNINGKTGKVNAVGIMATELLTPDNVLITIPNAQVWGTSIENYTRMPLRRADVAVGIAYGSSVEKAVQVAMDIMKAHPLVLDDPEPAVMITELADSSVNLALRPWAKTEDYWAVKGAVSKAVLEELPKAGIEIPFPQLDVHMKQQ
jgi:small-conductance mechanosensitive channel